MPTTSASVGNFSLEVNCAAVNIYFGMHKLFQLQNDFQIQNDFRLK